MQAQSWAHWNLRSVLMWLSSFSWKSSLSLRPRKRAGPYTVADGRCGRKAIPAVFPIWTRPRWLTCGRLCPKMQTKKIPSVFLPFRWKTGIWRKAHAKKASFWRPRRMQVFPFRSRIWKLMGKQYRTKIPWQNSFMWETERTTPAPDLFIWIRA